LLQNQAKRLTKVIKKGIPSASGPARTTSKIEKQQEEKKEQTSPV
jgi:hypothetical protein